MKNKITIGGVIVLFLVTVLAVSFLGNRTSGFQKNPFEKEVNADNYYTVECVELEDGKLSSGIRVDVDEDYGFITLNGTVSSDAEITVGSVTLKAGTYTFTAYDDASQATVYVTAKSATTEYKFDFSDENTITVDDSTEFDIVIHVKAETKLEDVKIYPVIVSGDKAGEFWD